MTVAGSPTFVRRNKKTPLNKGARDAEKRKALSTDCRLFIFCSERMCSFKIEESLCPI